MARAGRSGARVWRGEEAQQRSEWSNNMVEQGEEGDVVVESASALGRGRSQAKRAREEKEAEARGCRVEGAKRVDGSSVESSGVDARGLETEEWSQQKVEPPTSSLLLGAGRPATQADESTYLR